MMMPKYIDANALVANRVSNDPVRIAAEQAPVIEANEIAYGSWERYADDDGEYVICSECGQDTEVSQHGKLYAYCPHCGADMLTKQRARKVIAIDFDGCLCTNAWPKIGEPCWVAIAKAKDEQARGAALILWTCREGTLLEAAVNAAAGWGLHFDAINKSLPEWIEIWGSDPRKIGATEYWDDKAIRMEAVQE